MRKVTCMGPEVKAKGSSYCCQQLPSRKVKRGQRQTCLEGPATGQEVTHEIFHLHMIILFIFKHKDG